MLGEHASSMSSKCGHCIGVRAAASRYQVGAISGRLVMQVMLLARICDGGTVGLT